MKMMKMMKMKKMCADLYESLSVTIQLNVPIVDHCEACTRLKKTKLRVMITYLSYIKSLYIVGPDLRFWLFSQK